MALISDMRLAAGMMGTIPSDVRSGLLELFYGVYEKDPDRCIGALVTMGVLIPGNDMTAVRRTAAFFLNNFEVAPSQLHDDQTGSAFCVTPCRPSGQVGAIRHQRCGSSQQSRVGCRGQQQCLILLTTVGAAGRAAGAGRGGPQLRCQLQGAPLQAGEEGEAQGHPVCHRCASCCQLSHSSPLRRQRFDAMSGARAVMAGHTSTFMGLHSRSVLGLLGVQRDGAATPRAGKVAAPADGGMP